MLGFPRDSEISEMSEMSLMEVDALLAKLAKKMAKILYAEDPNPDVVFSKACRSDPDVVCEKLVRNLLDRKDELGISDDAVWGFRTMPFFWNSSILLLKKILSF
jgi:hypothetical protein